MQPNLKRQIRSPDLHFVKCLREEMLKNPTLGVAPLVALVILPKKRILTLLMQRYPSTKLLEAIILGL